MDIQMPNYNGIELLNNIRKYRPTLPVIIVSAHQEFALEAAKLNPFCYLLKPVNISELSRVIEKFCVLKIGDTEEKYAVSSTFLHDMGNIL